MKVRVFEAFAGYGSQSLALERLKRNFPDFDYEIVGISEIDKYAIQAYNALHPNVPNFGDISKIDWSQVPDFDLFTYSSPCFVAGTKVLTKFGYKSIEDIQIGDEVFTHSHTFKPVTAIGSDGYRPIWKIQPMGAIATYCTINHPFLIRKRLRKWDNSIRRWKYEYTDAYKSRVEEFTGDEYVGIPILPTLYKTEYNDEVLWVVGRYIADGHLRENELIISVGKDKLSQFKNITMPHRIHKNSDSCYRVVFGKSTPVYSAVEELTNCGKALTKSFNTKCLFFDKEDVRILLEGYMSGDGCYIEKSHSHQATTISKNLANQLVLMVQKTFGVGVKVYETKRPKKYIIQGREVNQHDTYMIRYQLHNEKKSWYNDGKFIWYPIKEVKDMCREEKIYNITVADDHTYTANNITCFNCQDFSNAGLQKGGTEGSGTRSSLLWECRRAIVAKRPKYLLLENVAALVSQKFLPLFNKWQAELASYGYSNFAEVLNAKDFGVPQNRERVFLVSILGESSYHFPKPFKLEKRLKDVLEENVDEKYYLSDKMIDYMNRTSSGGIKHGKGIRTLDDETCGTIMAEAQLKTGGGAALLREEQCDIYITEIKCIDYKAPNGGSGTGYSQYFIIEIKYSNDTIQQMELHTWYRSIEVIISDFLSGLNYCPDMKYQKADVSLLFIALSEWDANIWEDYKAFVEHSKEGKIIG